MTYKHNNNDDEQAGFFLMIIVLTILFVAVLGLAFMRVKSQN